MSSAEKVRRHRERKRRVEFGRTVTFSLNIPNESKATIFRLMKEKSLTMGEALEYAVFITKKEVERLGGAEGFREAHGDIMTRSEG